MSILHFAKFQRSWLKAVGEVDYTKQVPPMTIFRHSPYYKPDFALSAIRLKMFLSSTKQDAYISHYVITAHYKLFPLYKMQSTSSVDQQVQTCFTGITIE